MKTIAVFLALIACASGMSYEEFGQFQAWMAGDPTDLNQYANVTYDCLAFSTALTENATLAGQKDIYMANIQAPQYPEGHWINAALVEGEYVFIEPQADKELFFENASITILDDSMQGLKELKGKNKITVTGNMLIPVKA